MRDAGKTTSLLVGHSFGGAAVLAAAEHIPETDAENAALTDRLTGLHKPLMVLHSPTDSTVGIGIARTIFRTARHPRSFVSWERSDHLLIGKGEAARAGRIISVWAGQYLDAAR